MKHLTSIINTFVGNIVINSSGSFTSNGGSGNVVRGSGVTASEGRQVQPFNAVAALGYATTEVVVGPERSVRVEADDNILGLVTTTVSRGVLSIGVKGSFSTNNRIVVYVTTPTLTSIENTGSGEISASGVNARDLQLDLTGSGDIEVSGHADNVNARLTGSGDISTTQLIASTANVSIHGSGDIRVYAARALTARIAGSGDIRYSGDCTEIDSRVSGSGSIRRQK